MATKKQKTGNYREMIGKACVIVDGRESSEHSVKRFLVPKETPKFLLKALQSAYEADDVLFDNIDMDNGLEGTAGIIADDEDEDTTEEYVCALHDWLDDASLGKFEKAPGKQVTFVFTVIAA